MANVRWIQVLESKAPIEIILHWQAWFDSRGIKHAMRPFLKGPALSRAMTRTEYAAFRTIEGSHRSDRKSPKIEAARLRADRERYQRDKPTPDQLLAEGGHTEFVPLGEMVHQISRSISGDAKLTFPDDTLIEGADFDAHGRLCNAGLHNELEAIIAKMKGQPFVLEFPSYRLQFDSLGHCEKADHGH